MKEKKYVAYVGTYTHGNSKGIYIYDLDVENGRAIERKVVPINNPSYIKKSHNGKYLYSISDEGVRSFKILPDGDLEPMNSASICGMRGCYLSTDYDDKFLFVAGYHDAKLTALRVNSDGSVGEITDEIFHRGLGSIAERNFRPHISCVKMTRDNRYLCAADLGMDHIVVYELDHESGRLQQVDIIRSEQESAPRHLKFSKDGRYMYVVHELKNYIDVYHYYIDEHHDSPEFEKIQTISTLNDYHAGGSAASALNISDDFQYLVSSNAGDNSVVVYRIDQRNGMLEKLFCLPISGDYPKDATLFPDNKHLVSLNHESNTMTIFRINYEKKYFSLWGKPLKVETPNCILVSEIEEAPKQ